MKVRAAKLAMTSWMRKGALASERIMFGSVCFGGGDLVLMLTLMLGFPCA